MHALWKKAAYLANADLHVPHKILFIIHPFIYLSVCLGFVSVFATGGIGGGYWACERRNFFFFACSSVGERYSFFAYVCMYAGWLVGWLVGGWWSVYIKYLGALGLLAYVGG